MIQELAIILFSQVTSASACETNWSQFEYVYSKRRNKLRTEKARKLVYVHSNLKLLNDIASESASGQRALVLALRSLRSHML